MNCNQWIFDMDGTLTDSMTAVWENAPLALLRVGSILLGLAQGSFSLGGLLPLVWLVVFVVMCASSAYYQFTGIRLR